MTSSSRQRARNASAQPQLPKDPVTLRRAHRALHDFTAQLRGELDTAISNARQRRHLGAARHVEHICRFILEEHRAEQEAGTPDWKAPPMGLVVSADLATGLRYVDQAALAERIDAWAEAVATLASYEGKRFERKRPALARPRNDRGEDTAGKRNAEDEALATLEREARLLLKIFRDVAARLERGLATGSAKRKSAVDVPTDKLTPPEVAKLLKVSPDKVRQWIANGELPATNVASAEASRARWIIDRADLEQFQRSRRPAQPAAPITRRRRKDPEAREYF